MGTVTPRTGLIQPSEDDYKQVQDLNVNASNIDKMLGSYWVPDNGMPAVLFDGAIFKESTSGVEYILKSNGSGGFNKVARTASGVGSILHYTKSVGSLGNTSAPSNSWQTVSGSSVSWTNDRPALASLRIVLDVTANASAQGVKFRVSGMATTESAQIMGSALGTRQQIATSFMLNLGAPGPFTFTLDIWNFVSSTQIFNGAYFYIDTNAVLT